MIIRHTTWHNDRGDCVQVEAAILADWWEPLVAHARNVGPFDEAADVMGDALEDCLAWYRLHGVQAMLWDGPEAP